MDLTDNQIKAIVRYVTILGNIQKRCLMDNIDIYEHKEKRPVPNRTKPLPQNTYDFTSNTTE
jgi:hypothetical protein